jgi:hypothetical protein
LLRLAGSHRINTHACSFGMCPGTRLVVTAVFLVPRWGRPSWGPGERTGCQPARVRAEIRLSRGMQAVQVIGG